jgi:CxxC-x17-CxxC domain-containing protein
MDPRAALRARGWPSADDHVDNGWTPPSGLAIAAPFSGERFLIRATHAVLVAPVSQPDLPDLPPRQIDPDGPIGRGFPQVYTDRVIACIDCGQEFTFTAGEQEFYEQRGFTEAPKRCTSCRAARKAQRSGGGASSSSSGGYNGSSYDRGPSSYSGGGGGYERRPRQMYSAVCANCGRTAQVPFQPTGARPVYCSDCFQTRR